LFGHRVDAVGAGPFQVAGDAEHVRLAPSRLLGADLRAPRASPSLANALSWSTIRSWFPSAAGFRR
jgi:hypothetical protein